MSIHKGSYYDEERTDSVEIVYRTVESRAGVDMADRKQFLNAAPADAELLRLHNETKDVTVTEDQLREQRISFAYGNLMDSKTSTKESVRLSATYMSFANRRAAESGK